MRTSTDHILTSHVGSLPRPDDLIEANRAREAGEATDEPAFQETLRAAVDDVVRHQKELGIDVPGDGEFGKSMGHRVNYGAWWNYAFLRLGGLELGGPSLDHMTPRRARPGEIVLTNAARRRDRVRFAAAYADREFGRLYGAAPVDRAGLRRPADLHRPRRDQGRHRQLQGGAGGGRGRGRLYDLGRARQRLSDPQHLLQERRGVPLRLGRGDARGIQGDRRCRAGAPARRSGDRDRLGHDRSRAQRSKTTGSSR